MILNELRNKIILFNLVMIILFVMIMIKYNEDFNLINLILLLGVSISSYVLLEKYRK